MLDIKKALASLRRELGRINEVIEVAEVIASRKYEKRVKRQTKQGTGTAEPVHQRFVPPANLDPDATLWLN